MKKRKPEPLKVPKNSLIDVPTNRVRRLHDKIDLDIIMGKQSHGIVGAKLKRSYFKPKEDLVLFHVKVASSVLMEGVLGIQERFFDHQYRTFGSFSSLAPMLNNFQTCYKYPIANKQLRIPWGNLVISEHLLRDFLRNEYYEGRDKTSRACQKIGFYLA